MSSDGARTAERRVGARRYAASRADVLPRALSRELRPLADGAPALPLSSALRAAVAAELGLERLVGPRGAGNKGAAPFAAFDDEALAASSIGQVHRAEVWADDGVDQGGDTIQVAVKVARPGARLFIEDDLALLGGVVRALTIWETDLRFLRRAFADYAAAVSRELDLTEEARNTADARAALDAGFRGGIVVPRVVAARPGALVLSLEEGFRADDGDALDRHRLDRARVFARAVRAVARGLFGEGLCHADPHAGNVTVRPDPMAPDGFEVVLLDWGLCARLDDDARAALAGAAYATRADRAELRRRDARDALQEDGTQTHANAAKNHLEDGPRPSPRAFVGTRAGTRGTRRSCGRASTVWRKRRGSRRRTRRGGASSRTSRLKAARDAAAAFVEPIGVGAGGGREGGASLGPPRARARRYLLHDPGSGRGRRARRRARARHPSPLLDDVAGLPPDLLLVLRSVSMLRGLAATLDVAGDRRSGNQTARCLQGAFSLGAARGGRAPEHLSDILANFEVTLASGRLPRRRPPHGRARGRGRAGFGRPP